MAILNDDRDIILDQKIEDEINYDQGYFYSVATFKLILLSLCTLGLYNIFWFYKSWVYIRESSNKNVSPVWRAIFSPIWAYSCFNSINSEASRIGITTGIPSGLLAFLYFLFNFSAQLPNPFWLLYLATVLLLVPANSLATKVNLMKNNTSANSRKFTLLEWCIVVFGGILFIALIIGSFLPDDI